MTGATGGIGGAIATALANDVAAVCLVGRNESKLAALPQLMRTNSSVVEAWPADLTDDLQIQRLSSQAATRLGRLDILVHCAGTIAHGKLEESSVETLDGQYAANVRGPYSLTRELLPLLKRPRGQIVFINSSAGLRAPINAGQFSATQHALKALADAFREELNAESVRVLSVFPGRTATPRVEAMHRREERRYEPELLLQPSDVASVVLNALALPWTAEVTNISIRPMLKSY